ncbi:MAG: hypothetical protein ACD_29C00449G0005 [uncultured bacterium]|nr:MAG: hypothetical protein ACD_29C00449G0005 [uncultured bacterium]
MKNQHVIPESADESARLVTNSDQSHPEFDPATLTKLHRIVVPNRKNYF